ncbi:MAG TPA: Tat pathway signal protein [Burkholderiales bacterium]|nr:Tat pathway signal protein [Burkholderiales bacterium]
MSHKEVARTVWHHATGTPGDTAALLRELVRYATLAPSSHNTQCWKFRLRERAIVIEPDLTRRCPVVDPDDHHLFVSLGCAAENLAQAALAYGMRAEIRFEPAGNGALFITLEPTQAVASTLFKVIPERQSTRGDYDTKPLSSADLRALEQAGSGAGVGVILLTERQPMEKVLEYVIAGNTAQMNDPAFVAELKAWIRFGEAEAVRLRDGLFSGSSGNPNLPRWLASPLMSLFFTPKAENDKYARQMRSSAGIAIFVSETNDMAHWVEAGRCYERFALQSTALGIRNAFLNQPVEVATLRPQFASWLGVSGLRPDLIVRFGRGPKMPASLRRPVEAVFV